MRQRHPGAGRRSAAFRLERLEPRVLLAKATPKIAFLQIAMGNSFELAIIGTSKNDSISIVDDGTGNVGNIHVSTSDGQTFTSTHPISGLGVVTGQGTDHVDYTLAGTLQGGQNRFIAAASAGSASSGIPAVKGGGNLFFTVNQPDAVAANAQLLAFGVPDPKGKTTMVVNGSGEVAGSFAALEVPSDFFNSSPSMTSNPKLGPVSFTLNSTSRVDSDGTLSFGAIGGSNKNTMSANYFGRNDGDINCVEDSSGAGSPRCRYRNGRSLDGHHWCELDDRNDGDGQGQEGVGIVRDPPGDRLDDHDRDHRQDRHDLEVEQLPADGKRHEPDPGQGQHHLLSDLDRGASRKMVSVHLNPAR